MLPNPNLAPTLAHRVPCPTCAAPTGIRCSRKRRSPSGALLMRKQSHIERWRLARKVRDAVATF